MHKKLVNYVRTSLHQGYTLAEVAERLRQEGWEEDEIERALADAVQKHVRKARLLIALAGLLAFLALGILAYLFLLSPAFVEEPVLERPLLVSESVSRSAQTNGIPGEPGLLSTPVEIVAAEHIRYVLTEIGAYKLHANPFTGDLPEIEILLSDISKTYTAIINDNAVEVVEGASATPDVRVEVTQDAVVELATAESDQLFDERAARLLRERDQRGFTGKLLTSQSDLLLKGYLSLYNEQKEVVEAAGITGGAIAEVPLAGSGMLGMFVIIIVLWGAIIVRMAFTGEPR
jgi:hypothetical protein